jgi:Bacteriophage protein gp37
MCYPFSDGCTNCYFYGPYAKSYGQNKIEKTDRFDWLIRMNAKGEYNIKGDKVLATCFATDFFLPEADEWCKEVWAMIHQCQDIEFLILTKRIDRFYEVIPMDWGDGYDNVNLGCTVENQAIADYRLSENSV